jgi:ketosteroid isomerase-like protein
VRGFFAAFARRDLDEARSLMTRDMQFHMPGAHPLAGDRVGPDEWFRLAGDVLELTEGTFRLKVHDVLANDEHGVALVDVHAERAGEAFNWNRLFVYHFARGKISEVWIHETDQAGVDRLFH